VHGPFKTTKTSDKGNANHQLALPLDLMRIVSAFFKAITKKFISGRIAILLHFIVVLIYTFLFLPRVA